jgi:hypothetical protein
MCTPKKVTVPCRAYSSLNCFRRADKRLCCQVTDVTSVHHGLEGLGLHSPAPQVGPPYLSIKPVFANQISFLTEYFLMDRSGSILCHLKIL